MKVLFPTPPTLWDRVCAAAPECTFFHTRPWVEAFVRTYPSLRIATRAFALANGTTAVFPLVSRSSGAGGLFLECESMIPGVYGGIVADGALSPRELERMFEALVGWRVMDLTVTGNPYATWRLPDRFQTSAIETHAVDLAAGTDGLWTNLSEANRRAVRKAERSRIEVSVSAATDDYRSYYACYHDSLRRWGDRATSQYPFELLLNIRDHAGDRAKLWLAKLEGRVVSGSLVLYHGQHAVYWHGASLEEFLHLRPSNLVHWEAIRDAQARGFRWFDFNPSGGHEGVARYKATFGPTVLRFERGAHVSNRALVACYRRVRYFRRRILG